jgi:hypothetical protein
MTDRKKTQHAKIYPKDILYISKMLEMRVTLLPMEIGPNVTKENLRITLETFIGGKCIEEGYVKPNTIKIQSYSAGVLKKDRIEFYVVFECKTYNPAEGSWIKQCRVSSVTKAGIHADVVDEENNIPATVFIIRDHFGDNKYFNTIQEQDLLSVKVIGVRFELNDPFVEILGNLMPKEIQK